MSQPDAVIGEWIEKINNEGRDLSKWELDFMESITDQWERGGPFSTRQAEIVERIYAEKTP